MNRIAVATFGCKINQYESAGIIAQFEDHGFQHVAFDEEAEVYVVNSCTVTNRTDFKSRNAIRKILKKKELNPNLVLIITGCYVQRNREELRTLGDIDIVVDNQHKNIIYDLYCAKQDSFDDIMKYKEFSEMKATEMYDRSRAFVKIQDGCNFFCTYCAIPYARGTSRSRKKEDVLEQIKILVDNGYHEVVLGGINMGLYGRDLYENYFFADLLADIEKISGLDDIRLSSIEPQLFTPDVLDFFKNSKKITPHFHIPLQSGSDSILKAMKRHYDTAEFRQTISNIISIFPNAAFGIDVIVGFPGESDSLFQETYDFLASLPITYLHVFTYSRRKGTPAFAMKNQINGTIKKERTNKLIDLSNILTKKYIDLILTQKIELTAVVEEELDGMWTSLSDHFVRIYYYGKNLKKKEKIRVKPIRPYKEGIKVEIID
ncbi:tRNA (N(6)-L-threonylcarbamoyladenosine(37)-C(2))-methylthiotransferase MtaB [bacterium]|nr:tRNA (N(6)-L-threonylcarbamoyladenosine(37)-C(2))-methylthiotransferase MtaB [bacterium]